MRTRVHRLSRLRVYLQYSVISDAERWRNLRRQGHRGLVYAVAAHLMDTLHVIQASHGHKITGIRILKDASPVAEQGGRSSSTAAAAGEGKKKAPKRTQKKCVFVLTYLWVIFP